MAGAVSGVEHRPTSATAARRFERTATRNLFVASGIALSLVALVLRLAGIDHEPLWLDEGYTLLFSRLPLDRLLAVGGAHEHPPLYYLIVHGLLAARDSYLIPRFVSAAAGAAGVAALFALGMRLFGRTAGFVAALCLAISPFHLWYSQDGRTYELAGLLVLLSYLALVTALRRPRRSWWVAYVVVTALALYTEYTVVLVLLPQTVVLVRREGRGLKKPLLLAWGGICLLFAPWVGMLLVDLSTIAGNYWIPSPTANSLVSTVLLFLGLMDSCPSPPCTGAEASLPLLVGHEGVVALAAGGAIVATLVWAIWKDNYRVLLVTLWLLVPFVVVLLLAIRRSLYLDRVFLDASYALYLLFGAAIAGLVRRRLGPLAVALLAVAVAANLVNVRGVYSETTNPDWRTLARDLGSAYRQGDAVVYHPGVLSTLVRPYLPHRWSPTRQWRLWYTTYLDVPGWQDRYHGQTDAQIRSDELTAASRGIHRLWLVAQDYTGLNDTRYWFTTHGFHLLLSEIYTGDTRLELWSREGPASIGPAVPGISNWARWARRGSISVRGSIAVENGGSTLTRSFPVVPGRAYSVDIDYQGIPPAHPQPSVTLVDRSGGVVEPVRDRFGQLLTSYPRSEWYDWPVNGAWLAQPIGFVAPPGAVGATLTLRNLWGQVSWQRVGVYQER